MMLVKVSCAKNTRDIVLHDHFQPFMIMNARQAFYKYIWFVIESALQIG